MPLPMVRAAVTAFGLLVVFGSGYRLSRAGAPYSGLLLSAHKLIAVGVLAFLVTVTLQAQRSAGLPWWSWLAAGLAGAAFLGAIATGGWLSAAGKPPGLVRLLHRVLPWFAALGCAVVLALLWAG